MSNLLKSKFLLGVMVVAVMLVGVVAISAASASADCSVTPTLKVGSTGASVQCLQTKLGLTADGSFGPMTKAAVMSFQTAHNLTADGIVGPLSASELNSGAAPATGGTFPAGCSSASGFSTTTGQPCNSSSTLPAGCTSTSGFSSTTGAKCDGGSSSSNSGPLSGGAADITATQSTTDVETTVNEGATDTKVHAFKVQADGGDVAVTNVKVTLLADGASSSSFRLNRYASKVSVWEGSTKVGSADVADFTKTGNTYTKSIALSNAIVREGSNHKQTFYVTVDANDTIDSNDFAANWTLTADSIRFQDSTGVVLTSNYSQDSVFHFTSLASSGDVKVVVSKDTSSPIAGNITVSTTATSKNVLLLAFKVKATGSDVSFDTLNITTGLSSVSGDTRNDIISELQLKNGSDTLATISSLNGSETFNLDSTFTVAANTTEVFKVYATVNKSNAGAPFHSGSGVSASFASFSPEDSNGDIIADTGSASGETQTFVVDVPTVALVGTPALVLQTHTDGTTSGLEDLYKATIVMDVTAPDTSSIYLPLDTFAYGTAGTQGVEYTASGGTITSASFQYSGSDSILDTNSYRVDAGATQRFTLTVYLKGDDTQGKVQIGSLWYETTAGLPDGTPSIDTGWTNFKTPLVLLAK